MGVHWVFSDIRLALAMLLLSVVLKIVYSMWILPNITYLKIKRNGLSGPSPRFPLGNITDMVAHSNKTDDPSSSSFDNNIMSHHIHSKVFPYFAQWQQSHGKVFVYWLGTEPFLYIADPEFLKQMSSAIKGKSWGKPSVFRNDRKPMFGTYGLTMVEGDDWVRHRSVLTPAFSLPNIKTLRNLMVTVTNEMLDRWTSIIKSGQQELDIESEISSTMGMIVAKTTFGMKYQNGKEVLQKLREMHQVLYTSNRYVGVPFSQFLSRRMYLKAKSLGDEIDAHFVTIINDRIKLKQSGRLGSTADDDLEKNLLDLMLAGHDNTKALTTKELVDECKTFFVGGHETSALALTWTLFLLAMHPEWQNQLREEIREVVGDEQVDVAMLGGLKKMNWVMSEALRLYPSAPNAQRQAKSDIHVGEVVIAKGTNIWIDLVAMHHDSSLWGDTANEFRPERFETDLYGGCKHKMGYAPFGFGGRMCIGRNLAVMEYRILLCLILTRFSFSLSPCYSHSPAIMFSLRPSKGMLLMLQPV
ncbi:hypothetical protein DCAR_0310598 [Daucus carota subsp. sativus]|uniref:Uncharacterized protein n=2 Tax=Daucus carota subsp. sativus TaxID=79200 RepID=A0A166A0M9_DAUCS|nr:PREDICTED: cytokinin hydroxylase-like [Daucus carota subsp. sativus]WOG91349.1 hypothetical protein DCAR_0310598 [Daucus carota subsp. sativus]